jgi:UDP-N-acetylglucosamine 2-epimerase (non-hydrolysing)
MKILHVVGARPNFPKLAPVYRAADARGVEQIIVHTGQHYDDALSGNFFRQLGIPAPHVDLGVGSSTHAVQTARIIERIEPVILETNPDWVVVYGDVNSTMAAALVAAKLQIPVAHVEAGLRSYDRSMPEEINRIVTDRLADLLLVPSLDVMPSLREEGEPDSEIEFIGNVMIDSLLNLLPSARLSGFRERSALRDPYIVVTLHRPSNVDDRAQLTAIGGALRKLAETYDVVFPAHPRTQQRLNEWSLDLGRARVIPPLAYTEMLDLVDGAFCVITDSGGVQEETTALGIPCFTVRPNTERPITLTEGSNTLVPDVAQLVALVKKCGGRHSRPAPAGWDGKAGERAIEALFAAQRQRELRAT